MRPLLVASLFASLFALPLLAQAAPPAQPPVAKPPVAAGATELAARLQAELTARLGDLAPGAQAAVLLPDDTLVPFVAGGQDAARTVPMTHDGKLLAGSTGKTFFAALAAALAAAGELDLDRKVAHWLGDEPWFARLPNAAALTPRLLLQHRSGLMRYEFDPRFTAELLAKPDHRFTPQEELAFVLDQKPRFAAGEGFEYSDTNYVLLGLVLERITKRPCYDAIRTRFLEPLRLSHTVPSVGRKIPGLVQGHAGPDNPFGGRDAMLVDGELPFDVGFEGAGGGFASTASDLVRWARALWGTDLLGPMREQVLAGLPAPLGKDARYGLGVILTPTAHGVAQGHRGFFPGWLSEVRWYPDAKLAVAVLVNGSAHRRLPRELGVWCDELVRVTLAR